MISETGLTVREAIHEKGTPYAELGLGNPDLSDDRLLDAMLKVPILIAGFPSIGFWPLTSGLHTHLSWLSVYVET